MARIVIDSEVDEYEHALELVDALFGRTGQEEDIEEETPEETSSAPTEKVVPVEGFTPKRMHRYVQNLTIEGHGILRYLAQHAPQIDIADAQEHFSLGPRQWAGTMSTFGYAKRETPGVDRMPFVRDNRRFYVMDERVAKMALAALDKLGL
jgi:hypothetical protein